MTSLPASLIVHTEARDGSKHITGMNTVRVALGKQTRAESRMKKYEDGASTSIYFFLAAFSADFVTKNISQQIYSRKR